MSTNHEMLQSNDVCDKSTGFNNITTQKYNLLSVSDSSDDDITDNFDDITDNLFNTSDEDLSNTSDEDSIRNGPPRTEMDYKRKMEKYKYKLKKLQKDLAKNEQK